ncbi:MAG: amino acid transporter [Methanomethylophilus alvi]|nr:MAG: amino acid transporter [Methanomethylophilus alvi]
MAEASSPSESYGTSVEGTSELARTIDWKQGVIIAMGVPILILPSLYDLSGTLWAMSIAIWVISVLQGFLQNMAIGEMAANFGVSGIGACAQYVFDDEEKYRGKKVNWGKFIGAFTAWSYWFTWTPVIPIFTIMTGTYLQSEYFDEYIGFMADIDPTVLNLVLGAIIYGVIVGIGSRGLSGGATAQLILSLITIVPLVIVVAIPFIDGSFSLDIVSRDWTSPDWEWDANGFMLVFGFLATAQWSACAWESCATYGAEYKDPGHDLPKALIACGLICLFMYFIVSLSVFGTLGYDGVDVAGYATLAPLCVSDFGDEGALVALILLVAGMVMLIQTAFLGSSRTLFAMSQNGNMPKLLSKTNKNGAPIYAMFFQFAVGMCLIPLGTPGMILAASSFGFCFALGMAMICFLKTHYDPKFKDRPRVWNAPKGWVYVVAGLAIYQFFILIPCLAYESNYLFGPSSVVVGAIILLAYIPLWFALQAKEKKAGAVPTATAASGTDPGNGD